MYTYISSSPYILHHNCNFHYIIHIYRELACPTCPNYGSGNTICGANLDLCDALEEQRRPQGQESNYEHRSRLYWAARRQMMLNL